jgi:hypothetical protein
VAVQFARAWGATVIGTASQDNHDYVRALGATPVTYGDGLQERVRELAPQGVDASLDLTGSEEAITVSIAVTGDKARIVTLVSPPLAKQYGITMMFGTRAAETVAQVAALAAGGELDLPITRRFALAGLAEAHRLMETGSQRGKLVLTLVCDYGTLSYGPLEYLVIPKGTSYRLVPDEGVEHLTYVVETREPVALPDRGLLGHFLPFDRGVLDVPQLAPQPMGISAENADGEWEVLVKRDGELSSIFYAFDPADVEGWTGSLAPFRLRLADIRPLTSQRLDVPPMTHATFQSGQNWIVTMAPRPMQSAEDAERAQPYHRNVDYDEVIVPLGTHDGRRVGPPPGLMSVTPGGMNHGPNQARLAAARDRLPIYVWNIDTIHPLHYTDAFAAGEIPDFAQRESFRG